MDKKDGVGGVGGVTDTIILINGGDPHTKQITTYFSNLDWSWMKLVLEMLTFSKRPGQPITLLHADT